MIKSAVGFSSFSLCPFRPFSRSFHFSLSISLVHFLGVSAAYHFPYLALRRVVHVVVVVIHVVVVVVVVVQLDLVFQLDLVVRFL